MLLNTAAKCIHFSRELTVKDSFTCLGLKDFPHQTQTIEDLSSTGAFADLNIYILADQRREAICRTINYSLESLMVA